MSEHATYHRTSSDVAVVLSERTVMITIVDMLRKEHTKFPARLAISLSFESSFGVGVCLPFAWLRGLGEMPF